MAKIVIISLFLFFGIYEIDAQPSSVKFNSELADSLGADEYGMKMYSFVILKTGTNNMQVGAARDSIFSGHMANISRLVKEDKLIVAGPFGENDKAFRGLFIFTEPDIEKTKMLLATDPAISTGVLSYEIYPWYGSAALGMYLPFSEAVTKKNP